MAGGNRMIRRLVLLASCVLLVAVALGYTLLRTSHKAAVSAAYVTGDYDQDDDGGYDYDDAGEREYGRPGSAADMRVVGKLVKRYYSAASIVDGAGVCATMIRPIAESHDVGRYLAKEYESEEYEPSSPSLLRGRSCAEVASLVLQPTQRQLAEDAESVRLVSFGVSGAHGKAVLAFTKSPESYLELEREQGRWKIASLTVTTMP